MDMLSHLYEVETAFEVCNVNGFQSSKLLSDVSLLIALCSFTRQPYLEGITALVTASFLNLFCKTKNIFIYSFQF
jgi:hypothetical protein